MSSEKARDLETRDLETPDTAGNLVEESKLVPRVTEGGIWRLGSKLGKSYSCTWYGVLFNFIISTTGDVYISIFNDNGYPVIATVIDSLSKEIVASGNLGLSQHEAYQKTSAKAGDVYTFKVQS
ncbi:uncharacterized protein N7446_012231 [Penicillium canescens]|uniref:uncharacterized protein n=1 Tax=Penicillium canescens TaxID=5083 RepID=UPI0026DF2AA2|nr:uncharacterized protein N7446_012231 [Penicillium canescens]KAJ6045367.1 hypothetical protein N7446_012231 [Penicillium canescens]KAJ6174774.1 hypothetical protein N7485_004579 [Penicillium canescens]